MRGRLDVGQIELGDLADRFEDRVQLAAEAVQLLLAERQVRQPGDVLDLFLVIAIPPRILPDRPKAPSGALGDFGSRKV